MTLSAYGGRWALVTGGGDGVGRAVALGLGQSGMRVVVCDIRIDAAARVADEIEARGGQARALSADVSDRASLIAAADDLAEKGIVPSILVANAGVGAGVGVIDASPRAIEWVFSVNVLGVAWTAQAFVPHMLKQDGPKHVCVTASSASIVDVRGPFTLYAASKQATAGVAEALAAELAPKGVGVTILYPGLLNTNIWDAGRARPDRFGGAAKTPDHVGDDWRRAQAADIVVGPLLEAIASGGGRCVLDVTGEAARLFEARVDSIRKAFVALDSPARDA